MFLLDQNDGKQRIGATTVRIYPDDIVQVMIQSYELEEGERKSEPKTELTFSLSHVTVGELCGYSESSTKLCDKITEDQKGLTIWKYLRTTSENDATTDETVWVMPTQIFDPYLLDHYKNELKALYDFEVVLYTN